MQINAEYFGLQNTYDNVRQTPVPPLSRMRLTCVQPVSMCTVQCTLVGVHVSTCPASLATSAGAVLFPRAVSHRRQEYYATLY
jgi:hypothetical protein